MQRSQCLVEAYVFWHRVSVKCQLCARVHIQHSRHEAWDDKSEQKQILDVFPSITRKTSKDLRDWCVSVVVDKYWNWKESIHEVNSSEFSLELKLTKSYRNLLKLHNISKYMWNQVKLYIRTIFLLISFKTLIFYLFFLKFMHISGIFIFSL